MSYKTPRGLWCDIIFMNLCARTEVINDDTKRRQ